MFKPFSKEWNRLLHQLSRVAGTSDAAEDALQTAYLRVEEYRRVTPVAKPDALLRRVAQNLALDERRRSRRYEWVEVESLGAEILDDQPLQDEVLAARERLRRVETILARMPRRTREAFLMHRLTGLKYREIAERLAISVSGVEKHIARAALLLADGMRDVRGDA
ncbi:MAG: sigma-70 family RNA polymerase sigma factor [Caulobacteraceae bacterium]